MIKVVNLVSLLVAPLIQSVAKQGGTILMSRRVLLVSRRFSAF
jgi:hypothetical protein